MLNEHEIIHSSLHHLGEEIEKLDEELEKKEIKKQYGENETYIRITFFIFMVIWTFLVAINGLFISMAFPILLIPYASFGLGILNSDQLADDKLESDMFSATFITMGLVISMPLITFLNKDKPNKDLNHIIFLAMISTLCSYLHIWGDGAFRHVSKIFRSCLETMAITLYVYVLVVFFLLT